MGGDTFHSIHISNRHNVLFTYLSILFVNYTSIKLKTILNDKKALYYCLIDNIFSFLEVQKRLVPAKIKGILYSK